MSCFLWIDTIFAFFPFRCENAFPSASLKNNNSLDLQTKNVKFTPFMVNLKPLAKKIPFVRQVLKIMQRGLQMEVSHNLSIRILITSPPWALFESSLLIMFLIFSTEKSTSESDFSVDKGKSDGNVLPLSINEHCFAKKELKI